MVGVDQDLDAGRPAGGRRDQLAQAFTAHRARLASLAYRLTGSLADADDVLQETWIRLQRADADPATAPRDLPAWLTTTATRVALDLLGSAARRRETYVGPWLPEPRVTPTAERSGEGLETGAVLADEVSFALMVVLETLSPAQRAAFVLHDMFDLPFDEVADVLSRTPAAVRKLASRARDQVATGTPRKEADPGTHRRVVEAFAAASTGGDLHALAAALDPSVLYRADGGGLVRAAVNVVRGPDRVARLVLGVLGQANAGIEAAVELVNGRPGLVFTQEGTPVAVVAFTVTAEGRIATVDVQMNPEKLAHVR
jgi:RNA polymerase sigma-70 factor (ECF subfamily)